MIRVLAVAVFFVLSTAFTCGQETAVDRYSPRRVLPVPLRPIVDPKIVKASEATINGNDLIIGVEIDGQARAYPINQLTGPSREIINDRLAGTAIAATW